MSACLRSLILTVAGVFLLGGVGCTDVGTPTESGIRYPAVSFSSSGQSSADVSYLARFDVKPSITIAWAKKWIGPEGGRLDFHGFAIEVPPGAVDHVTQFSIRLPVDPTGSERVVAEFGPHGASFSQPVGIEFPYVGTSIYGAEGARVVWWDGSAWVNMGGAATADGQRLRTTTDHFSEFGTAEVSGGVVVSGG